MDDRLYRCIRCKGSKKGSEVLWEGDGYLYLSSLHWVGLVWVMIMSPH